MKKNKKKDIITKDIKKKNVKKKAKKQIKIFSFFKDVKKELKKVRWPNRKEMVTYSIATISFVIFFALFFSLSDLLLSALKMLVK